MRLGATDEERLFAESVRAAIGDWEPVREPELGVWQDDRDDALAARLAEAGWAELWSDPALVGAAVAGSIELGQACAPVCLVDEPALGGALAIGGRARHGHGASRLAVPVRGGGLALTPTPGRITPAPTPGRITPERTRGPLVPEPTLDGSGTVRVSVPLDPDELGAAEARERWRLWTAVTLGYLSGLAGEALERSVEHARTREQFGAPLASLPAVQGKLADAALAADGLELLAWAASRAGGTEETEEAGEAGEAEEKAGLDAPALLWAGHACREVTATAHQLHGALGFALETGLHRLHRRATAMQSWLAAACSEAR